MNRSHHIPQLDAGQGPDSVIPRCAETGTPGAMSNPTYPRHRKGREGLFWDRVDDAKAGLKRGASFASLTEKHGAIVVDQARWELRPGGEA